MTPEQKKIARLALAMLYVDIRDGTGTIVMGQLQDVIALAGIESPDWPFGYPDLQERVKAALEALN